MKLKLLSLFANFAALFAMIGAGTASSYNSYEPMLPKKLITKDKQ